MSDSAAPITAQNTIKEWMDHPLGGPVMADLLKNMGIDDSVMGQVERISLEALAGFSQGKIGEEQVNDLVRAANGGVLPEVPAQPDNCGKRFEGKVAIITGAASGIGYATASRIVAEGGTVIAVDMAEEGLARLVAASPEGTVRPVVANITSDEGIDAIMAQVDGRVDCLANVAGIMDGMMPLHEVDNDLWDRVMAVNVTGTFKLSRAVLPIMMAQKSGSIVNVASQAALRGNAAGTAYGTSKHAVVGMTKSEAFLYGPLGIRVNAVAPGGTATAIEGSFRSAFTQERMGPFLSLIPPVASAKEQAAAITWLLCDDSDNINGLIMPSDGGWSVQ